MEPNYIVAVLGNRRQKANLAGFGAAENLRLHPRRDERSRERREGSPDRV